MNSDNPLNPDKRLKIDQSIEERINLALDTSVETLSPEIRRRLNQARIKAVEKQSRPRYYWKAASAFSIMFALVVGWQLRAPPMQTEETPFADVLQEDLEMLDDLDFVYWMVEEQQIAAL